MTMALQMQVDELSTACLELGQGGAMEMGGNTGKQGVAMKRRWLFLVSTGLHVAYKLSPQEVPWNQGCSEASLMEFQGGQGRA